MIRRLIYGMLGVLMLSAAACSRDTIIPDQTLADIFHDAFLTNAYVGEQRSLEVDSLRIYEPVFERYGYTTEDVMNTIANFSRRKSARLGDVVELAIARLEREGLAYNREVAALDTIDNVALRTFTRTLVSDTLIRFRSERDTSRVNFVVGVRPGRYTVSYKYKVHEEDGNGYDMHTLMWLERDGSTYKANMVNNTLSRYSEGNVKREFKVDSTFRRLKVQLVSREGRFKQPKVDIRNLEIRYIPPVEEAVDSLYERQLGIRIFTDTFIGQARREAATAEKK